MGLQAQNWNFGAEAGYVRNTLALEDYNATPRNGFKFGAFAEYTLNNAIALEAGLAYVRKGATVSGHNINFNRLSSVKLAEMDYLQIPVTVGYKFTPYRDFTIKPAVGGYYAVGVKGDSFITGLDPFNQPYEARVSTFSGANGVPYRPCDRNDAGLTFALDLTYRHVSLKAEYDLGFVTATCYGNGKQRSFSVSLAYRIF